MTLVCESVLFQKGQKLVFGFTQFSKIKKTEDDHC